MDQNKNSIQTRFCLKDLILWCSKFGYHQGMAIRFDSKQNQKERHIYIYRNPNRSARCGMVRRAIMHLVHTMYATTNLCRQRCPAMYRLIGSP